MRNAYKIMVRKPDGKGPVGKYRCRWEDNIKEEHIESVGGCEVGFMRLKTGTDGEIFKDDNETSASIKSGELLD
jgi:hypothetical protein